MEGKPVYRDSLVLFLDVLGAKELALHDEAGEHLAVVDEALRAARPMAKDDLPDPWVVASWFSDNLALASPILEGFGKGEPELGNFLGMVARVQLFLALHGLFTRGGIARGPFFLDDNVAFGAALVEAVVLEQHAVYPRVTVSEGLIEMTKQHLAFYGNQPESAPHNRDLLVDHGGGEVFVNYLGATWNYVGEDLRENAAMIERHRDLLIERLERSRNNPRVWEKYVWSAQYHNAFCTSNGVGDLSVPEGLAARTFEGIASAVRPFR